MKHQMWVDQRKVRMRFRGYRLRLRSLELQFERDRAKSQGDGVDPQVKASIEEATLRIYRLSKAQTFDGVQLWEDMKACVQDYADNQEDVSLDKTLIELLRLLLEASRPGLGRT